jgi:hypothetical protein
VLVDHHPIALTCNVTPNQLRETVRHCASSTQKFLRHCACGHYNRIGLGATSHPTTVHYMEQDDLTR